MNNPILEIVMSSPALKYRSNIYPVNRNGKVPMKIRMLKTVKSDLPDFMSKSGTVAYVGQEYFVTCNSNGAISVILANGEQLGIRPNECEIVSWHPGE